MFTTLVKPTSDRSLVAACIGISKGPGVSIMVYGLRPLTDAGIYEYLELITAHTKVHGNVNKSISYMSEQTPNPKQRKILTDAAVKMTPGRNGIRSLMITESTVVRAVAKAGQLMASALKFEVNFVCVAPANLASGLAWLEVDKAIPPNAIRDVLVSALNEAGYPTATALRLGAAEAPGQGKLTG